MKERHSDFAPVSILTYFSTLSDLSYAFLLYTDMPPAFLSSLFLE